jgi:hypothetical protein
MQKSEQAERIATRVSRTPANARTGVRAGPQRRRGESDTTNATTGRSGWTVAQQDSEASRPKRSGKSHASESPVSGDSRMPERFDRRRSMSRKDGTRPCFELGVGAQSKKNKEPIRRRRKIKGE